MIPINFNNNLKVKLLRIKFQKPKSTYLKKHGPNKIIFGQSLDFRLNCNYKIDAFMYCSIMTKNRISHIYSNEGNKYCLTIIELKRSKLEPKVTLSISVQ